MFGALMLNKVGQKTNDTYNIRKYDSDLNNQEGNLIQVVS